MAAIDTTIGNFLRDAQYKVGKLTVTLCTEDNSGNYGNQDLIEKRRKIIALMDVIYDNNWNIEGGYNHIQFSTTSGEKTTWTESELVQEIEHIRYIADMNEIPYINFTGHYPTILQLTTGSSSFGSGSSNIPAGEAGQMLFFGASGSLFAEYVSAYGGYTDNLGINSYFSGRL